MLYKFTIKDKDNGKTIADVLRNQHGFSRLLITKIKKQGSCLKNTIPARMIDKVSTGDAIYINLVLEGELPLTETVQSTKRVTILYQDEWFLVVEKPSSMYSHPSYIGDPNSVTSELSPYRLHPVIRLDRDTSGLMILAKSGYAHYKFSQIEIEKKYLGYIYGSFDEMHLHISKERPPLQSKEICAPIARASDSIMEREFNPFGKYALTKYRELDLFIHNNIIIASKLEFILQTGRTHQIRVHSRHKGHSLIGDSLYPLYAIDRRKLENELGLSSLDFLDRLSLELNRQALHAYSLSFPHPITQEKLIFHSDLPNDMANLDANLRTLT